MPETVNTTPLQDPSSMILADGATADVMISVENVSMVFNMASEQLNSLKEYAIALMKKELRFKELRALDNVSLEIRKGDVFGILGTNGSGKSTLLKIVAGVLEPTEGSVTINGNIAPLIELGAGFDLELTARENIYLNGALLGYSKKFIDENFDEIVEFAEVEKFLDMPMKNYSSGMVARIAFAIATVIVPDILIVDEVLSVGDFMFQQKCERRISRLIKDHDVTVLIVSHSNDQIERLCNKAIWIEKGHTRMIGDAKDVCRTYRVLGGHTGSPESERRVFEMLNDQTEVPEGVIETILAEDRYGSAVKLNELAKFNSDSVVIAPGEDGSTCLIGASLAAILDAPMYPSKTSILPDIVAHALKQLPAKCVYLLYRREPFSDAVMSAIKESLPAANIEIIADKNLSRLAIRAYRAAGQTDRGQTAVISRDGNEGDLVSLLPYMRKNKSPLFFNDGPGVVDSFVLDQLCAGTYKQLLVLGGQSNLPDSCFASALDSGVEIIRFCGKDPYDANELINNWTEGAQADDNLGPTCLIVSSAWNPFDAFAIGPYAHSTNAAILFNDPQSLDSFAHALNYAERKGCQIKKLVFLGDHTRFTELDKVMLGKALVRGSQNERI